MNARNRMQLEYDEGFSRFDPRECREAEADPEEEKSMDGFGRWLVVYCVAGVLTRASAPQPSREEAERLATAMRADPCLGPFITATRVVQAAAYYDGADAPEFAGEEATIPF